MTPVIHQAVFFQVEEVKKYLEQRRATQIPLRLQFLYELQGKAGLGERKLLGQQQRTRPSSSRKVGSLCKWVRKTGVLTKNPISG